MHARVAGTYKGRDISSWAEDYPEALAKQIVTGMLRSRKDRLYKDNVFDECYAGTTRKRDKPDNSYEQLLKNLDLDKPVFKKQKAEDVPADKGTPHEPSDSTNQTNILHPTAPST